MREGSKERGREEEDEEDWLTSWRHPAPVLDGIQAVLLLQGRSP